MKLSDFSTLAEAQAYELTTYQDISVGKASQYFGLSGMLDLLETNSSSTTKLTIGEMNTTVGALCRTILNSAKTTGFAADPNEEDGIANRGAAQILVAASVFTQPLVDAFWANSEVKTKPYENATQAEFDEAKDTGHPIALVPNNEQHKAVINIITQPLKPVNVVVQQKLSRDGTNWTEWHDIGAFRNVYYPQRSYEFTVQKSPSEYRELQAISPLTLGMSQE
ncbi:hypothetical protein [Paraglaciecola sp.]|uniref:hypothetical protein n=1 Tax=Paraglaciecola sp. TaxID=1920173 RepID=UPI003EF540CE